MKNNKSIKWSYGLVVSLVMGLSGCYMVGEPGEPRVDHTTVQGNQSANAGANAAVAKQKTYASKDPVQKATPGPKRAAAPQLPVIQ